MTSTKFFYVKNFSVNKMVELQKKKSITVKSIFFSFWKLRKIVAHYNQSINFILKYKQKFLFFKFDK